jgi:hypothetical protein
MGSKKLCNFLSIVLRPNVKNHQKIVLPNMQFGERKRGRNQQQKVNNRPYKQHCNKVQLILHCKNNHNKLEGTTIIN